MTDHVILTAAVDPSRGLNPGLHCGLDSFLTALFMSRGPNIRGDRRCSNEANEFSRDAVEIIIQLINQFT